MFGKYILLSLSIITLTFGFNSCKKDKKEDPTPANLVFKFKFDPSQERLNNIGEPAAIPQGNAAQSPDFNLISAHYIELAPDKFTQVGEGAILYQSPETNEGGGKAIDFDQSIKVDEGEVFVEIPIKDIPAGSYEWLRVSLAYQNYDIQFRAQGLDLTGTIASFIGFNTYITGYTIKEKSKAVNANKKQGYWGFETLNTVLDGQAPGTTVPNPIASTSPIPAGSCLVTGPFSAPLQISGNETEDITVTISLSTNNSFEWNDTNKDGIFEPEAGEQVVDMGIRGLKPIVN